MSDTYQYPDFVLTIIPVTIVSAYGLGTALDAQFVAVTAAVGMCYLLIADGLFWHGPAE